MDLNLTLALTILAVGAVVALAAYAYQSATSSIYAGLLHTLHNDDGLIPANSSISDSSDAKYLASLAREGSRWSKNAFTEAHILGAVLLIGVLAYGMYVARKH